MLQGPVGSERRAAYDAGLRGDMAVVEHALAGVAGDPSPVARAWGDVLGGLLWFATPRASGACDPRAARLEAFLDAPGEVREIAVLAGALRVRAHLLAFEGPGLERSCELLDALGRGLAPGEASGWLAVARGWMEVARGLPGPDLEDVVRSAIRDGRADLVIEAAAVRALGAAGARDLAGALRLARRVSRMARTEAMPQLEYLAHLVLARLRRLSGKPHLGTRILSALLRVAPPAWRGWLEWELLLARGEGPAALEAPRRLADLLGAARVGDRARFDRVAAELGAQVACFAPLAEDLRHVLAVVDPRSSGAAMAPGLHAFCRGEQDEPPLGLLGVAGEGTDDTPVAWVLCGEGVTPRRVLSPGDGLARAGAPVQTLEEAEGRQLRTDSAIAALALSGPDGIEEGALFRRLYGFDYEAVRHQSVRAVLYGRVRKRLGAAARVERQAGRLRLVHQGLLLVPDPRSSPPAELRILRVLAERREAPAREVAARLGIPLRTAQDALRRLADDGALRAERRAHGLHYVLEDTTFSEPTRRHGDVPLARK